MQLRKCMVIPLLVGVFSGSTEAYVREYKKLYRENTRTTVDLMYDIHIPIPGMPVDQFLKLDPKIAQGKLYPTERKFLEIMRRWNASRYSCDLIWESPASHGFEWTPTDSCFIGLTSFFQLWDMKHVRYIPADRHRNCGFNSLFPVLMNGVETSGCNKTGSTFGNPAPLSAELTRMIERVSGPRALKQYKDLCAKVSGNLKKYFNTHYYCKVPVDFLKDFHYNDQFHELCDIEILGHILSSTTQRIVVYAGGWHCKNVSEFLEKNGYKVVCHQSNPSREELPVHVLAPLESTRIMMPY